MFTDLHLHTHYSDGTLSPSEVAAKAKTLGIGLVSVCDHNTVDAYPQLLKLCAENGTKLLSGVEIDCYMGSRYLHLLGYAFDLNNPALLALISDCDKKMRYQNDVVIINMAREYDIDLDEYAAYVSPPELGGYKNSNFLLHKGIIKSIPEYFPLHRKYGIDRTELGLPQLEHVCAVIKAAGGIPVVAHPWSRLDQDNFIAELQTAVDSGVMGLECYYPGQEEVLELCVKFCEERDLLITAGSDDHGEFNKSFDGIIFQMGEVMVCAEKLNLKGLWT